MTKKFSVVLTDESYNQINEIARELNITKSQAIRSAIEYFIEMNEWIIEHKEEVIKNGSRRRYKD